ncbi:MAG TPA: GNAT family N-acetyltransferase [Flavisolibacter sp.]|nr:GNAT family N-acetyltransferase [Flavisolibacter sp.]
MQEERIIQYVPNENINKEKWDYCILTSGNGLIYAYSWYLDRMADNWDALVLGDYDFVMPLPWRKKMGIHYLYYPAFVAQLGLFGNNITSVLLEQFFLAIPGKFRYWDMPLNHKNNYSLEQFHLNQRANYILDLNKPYSELNKAYRENTRRNIKKALGYGCVVKKGIDINEVIRLASEQPQQNETAHQDYSNFKQVYDQLKKEEKAITYGIFSNTNQLLASCALLFSNNRWYYILVGNHPNGRTLGASHLLIDAFIKDHAGREYILDFEGSDLRNLAFFYSSFGSLQETYTTIKLNRLPWYVRWAKQQ